MRFISLSLTHSLTLTSSPPSLTHSATLISSPSFSLTPSPPLPPLAPLQGEVRTILQRGAQVAAYPYRDGNLARLVAGLLGYTLTLRLPNA